MLLLQTPANRAKASVNYQKRKQWVAEDIQQLAMNQTQYNFDLLHASVKASIYWRAQMYVPEGVEPLEWTLFIARFIWSD